MTNQVMHKLSKQVHHPSGIPSLESVLIADRLGLIYLSDLQKLRFNVIFVTEGGLVLT